MDPIDFSALAARAATGLDDIRACLLLSRDGLTLGLHPPGTEIRAREAWGRLEAMGRIDRGFLTTPTEVVVVATRGPYSGIVVAGPAAQPGVLLDRLETSLRSAEELRLRGQAGGTQKPDLMRSTRTHLHGEAPARTSEPPEGDRRKGERRKGERRGGDRRKGERRTGDRRSGDRRADDRGTGETAREIGSPDTTGPTGERPIEGPGHRPIPAPPGYGPRVEAARPSQKVVDVSGTGDPGPPAAPRRQPEREVDPVALAREFSQLLGRDDEEREHGNR